MSDPSARNSSTCCAVRTSSGTWVAVVLTTLLWGVEAAAETDPLAWTNFLLGPEHSQWLVGALGRIATDAERKEFLSLEDDAAAAAFVERFWAQPGRERVRRIYDERAVLADRRFGEAAHPGRKTDRGTLFILFGEPEETSFEDLRHVDEPPVELWRYPKGAEVGLDGTRPERIYRFAKRGDLTRMFRKGGQDDPAVLRRRMPPSVRLPSGGRPDPP